MTDPASVLHDAEDVRTSDTQQPPHRDSPLASVPWWARILVLYVAARLLTSAAFLVAAHSQTATRWVGARPSFLDYATIWDGVWYRRIATGGYPSAIPVDAGGHTIANAWAFLPVYPGLVRGVMTATGLPFDVVSVAVSLLAGAGTALIFYRLMLKVLRSPGSALFATLLLCINPVALLFQVAYAESLGLLLLVAGLYLVVLRRYWPLVPIVILLAFTRPGEVAFALLLGLHIVYRLWRSRRDAFPAREVVSSLTATVAALAAGLAWPVIAGIATGTPSAYTDTELSWRNAISGPTHFLPFTPWFESGVYRLGSPLGIVAVAVFMALCGAMLFLPAVRRLGVDLRLWTLSYLLYIFAVFFPQSSTFRILLPLVPLVGALALPISRHPVVARVWRIALVVVFLLAQMYWIHSGWRVDGSAVTPP